LKGIKPAGLYCRQVFGIDLDFAADKPLGFRNRVDSLEFRDAPSMLPAARFDFRFALRTGFRSRRNDDSTAALEDCVLFEQLFDSDFAF
jgi:hypothetical protein